MLDIFAVSFKIITIDVYWIYNPMSVCVSKCDICAIIS